MGAIIEKMITFWCEVSFPEGTCPVRSQPYRIGPDQLARAARVARRLARADGWTFGNTWPPGSRSGPASFCPTHSGTRP